MFHGTFVLIKGRQNINKYVICLVIVNAKEGKRTGVYEGVVLYQLIVESCSRRVTLEQEPDFQEGRSQADTWGRLRAQ